MTQIYLKNSMVPDCKITANRTLRLAGLMATSALVVAWSPAAYAQSNGPIEVPFDEMFDLGTLPRGDNSFPFDLSADGSVVVGEAQVQVEDDGSTASRAFVWTPQNGMVDIGTLGGAQASARGVSADGNVVIGFSAIANNAGSHAFRWTADGGMQDLGTLGGTGSFAVDLSDDGSVIVGSSQPEGNTFQRAFRWTEATGMVDLGTLDGRTTYARATNADGSVVVGESDVMSNDNLVYSRAFRWTEQGMQDLGTLGGPWSRASDVSADGTIVIGRSRLADPSSVQAFRWTEATGMESLGSLGGDSSFASRISRDGSTIVGYADFGENGPQRAFRWTEATGMENLGTLGGDYSYGEDVSADGSVIVGFAEIGGETNYYHAFRWTEEDGMEDLGTLGGTYSYATRVSDDGSTIIGYSGTGGEDNHNRAFIYRTQMQDFTNMIASFGLLANDLALTTEFQRDMTSWAADGGCNPRGDQQFCLGVEGLLTATGADGTLGIAKREDQTVKFSGAIRASEQIVVGVGAVITDYRTPIGAITPEDGKAFGAWVGYDGDPASATGLSGRIGVAFASQDNLFQRGIGLTNVEVTPGNADIDTTTVTGEFSYGFDLGGSAVLAPVVGLSWQKSELDPFMEAPGDFPADFSGGTFDVTFATVGLEAIIPVGTGGTLTLGGMIEQDLNSDDIALVGTSQIPGMEAFVMPTVLEREETRPRAEASFSQQFGPGVVSVFGRVGSPTFGDKARYAVGIGFGIGF